jgi:antitoxin component YwqK of YwqJK toxin-antitoxin module
MLKCPNLPEILYPHVSDSDTWCKLSELNKKFYETAKKMLVTVKSCGTSSFTKLPIGISHGLYQNKYLNGQLYLKCHFKNGLLHGPKYEWYHIGNKWSKKNFINGKLHGHVYEWSKTGLLITHEYYQDGKRTERVFSNDTVYQLG